MKDITKLLAKGNLSPRERVLLVIRNEAHERKTGKGLVTEADIVALTRSWKPRDYREAEQYNKYLEVWNMFGRLEIDMQTSYLVSQLSIARLEQIAQMFYYKSDSPKQREHFLNRVIPDDHIKEFRNFFLQHSGFEYDRLVHLYTFYSLPKKLQQDILLLDPSVSSDHSYFLAEEQLAHILTGKQSLSEKEIDVLTKIVIDSIPWGQEADFSVVKISVKEVIFKTHFAGYSLLNFGKRLASRNNITYKSEDELHVELAKLPDLKYKLEGIVRDTIREGLFFNEYTPLCNSEGHLTFEGKTELRHDEIMRRWIKAKDKTVNLLQQYISSGDLVLKECPTKFFEVSLNKTFITGESLVQSNIQLPFVDDYQNQFTDLMPYSYPAFLVHESPVFENYSHLLAFKEITERMSEIIGEELSEKVLQNLAEISDSINTLNFYLRHTDDHIQEIIYTKRNIKYPIQTFLPDPSISIQNLIPKQNEGLEVFTEELSKLRT